MSYTRDHLPLQVQTGTMPGTFIKSVWILLLVPIAVIISGCTGSIRAPETVRDPYPVYIAETGSHGSIAIPTEHNTIVEWSFGDWYWYALDQKEIWRSPIILFGPSHGTLARTEIAVRPAQSPDMIRALLGAERTWQIEVEKEKALSLLSKLETQHSSGMNRYYDEEINTTFVIDRRNYSLAQTCNHVLSEWLRYVGCTIDGPYWFWDLNVANAKNSTSLKNLP